MIIQVKNGEVEPERAMRITKLAAQINESFYSEVKVQHILGEIGAGTTEIGSLPLNPKVKK